MAGGQYVGIGSEWNERERVNEPTTTYHLTPLDDWNAHANKTTYAPEGYETEGFIHCTDGEQRVIEVANRYYSSDLRPYCVLLIRRDRISAPVVYEDPDRVYPHIYGVLNAEAVQEIRSVSRDAEGRFLEIGEPLPDR